MTYSQILEMVCQASSTVLTLSPYDSVATFSCAFIPCILLCLFQRSQAFSLGISTKFNELIWCTAFWSSLSPALIGLILKSVYTPFPLHTHTPQSLSICDYPQGPHISPVPLHPGLPFLLEELKHSFGINYHLLTALTHITSLKIFSVPDT